MQVLTDDEDFNELLEIAQYPRRFRIYRHRTNHFNEWRDHEFIQRFRVSKQTVQFVVGRISEEISNKTERNHALSPEEMVLLTLRFYATGSFLQVIGDLCGVDKSTASRVVFKVSIAIARLHGEFIKMPTDIEYLQRTREEFYSIARFPRCIGALDCSHVKIQSPGGNEAESFRNRKTFFSYNVQAICDAGLKFQNIVCRWPGSAHDSTIFSNSAIRRAFEHERFGENLIIGDSGYPVKKYLLTPLANPVTAAQQLYNESIIRTRNTIERCFGVWKRRFPVLALGLRVKVDRVEAITIATAVLHNIARSFNDPEPHTNEEEEAAINFVNNVATIPFRQGGANINNSVRDILINDYFQNLV